MSNKHFPEIFLSRDSFPHPFWGFCRRRRLPTSFIWFWDSTKWLKFFFLLYQGSLESSKKSLEEPNKFTNENKTEFFFNFPLLIKWQTNEKISLLSLINFSRWHCGKLWGFSEISPSLLSPLFILVCSFSWIDGSALSYRRLQGKKLIFSFNSPCCNILK